MIGNEQGPLRIEGTRTTGNDVRTQNVTAALAIANIVKSSLGPVGLDKMLVDDIGDVTVTNDGATILKQLEVEHPAAKVLVELSQLQDQEVGDGTTSVVIIAAELLKHANDLIKNKIHATNIIAGYRLAVKEVVKYISNHLTIKSDLLPKDSLLQCARTSMSSKIIGPNAEFFSQMVVDAMLAIKTTNPAGLVKYPIKHINILKQHGRSIRESQLIHGYALNCTRAAQQMPKRVTNAKIALLDFDLSRARMKMGVQVLVTDPRELEQIREREQTLTRDRIKMILAAGANVFLTTKGIDDFAVKYFVEAGAIAVRRVKKEDLRHIAKLTGGQILLTLANLEGDESFDASALGTAEEVSEERLADDELIMIRGGKTTKAQSIILRGPNSFMLDEMERSVHDALCVVKRTLESTEVVVGGGAVEAALSIYLENFATTIASREQLAIAEFAEALLVIPTQLAVNAAQDATDLVAQLRAYHNAAQTDASKKRYSTFGLDLINGKIRDNLAAGVLEPALSKIKSIQFATEAAITILRIDDMFRLNPKQSGPPGEDD